jgi:hypothetical protein
MTVDVSLKRGPRFNLRKSPGTHFCYRLSKSQAYSAAGRIATLKENPNDVTGK